MSYSFCGGRFNARTALVASIFLALLALPGCGGSASGGEQVIVGTPVVAPAQCRVFIVDKDDTRASDANDGRYPEDGGTGPWRTIQHAIDSALPCDIVRVRAAATPYREGDGREGIVIANGGEDGRAVTLEGFPGERPVIDQQQDGFGDAPTPGFVLRCTSWITLRNFEIRNVAEAGVTSALTGCASHDITLEDLHIHAVYGGNLVAAIRLAAVTNVVLRNNDLHDVFKVRSDDTPVAVAGAATENIVIEQNSIAAIERAITLSLTSGQGVGNMNVHRNDMREGSAGFTLENTANGSVRQIDFFGNVVATMNTAIAANLPGTQTISSALAIHNNTFVGTDTAAITVDNFVGVSVFNNIFANAAGSFLDAGKGAQFDFVDYNLYWSAAQAEWNIEDGAAARTFTVFAEWQTALSIEQFDTLTSDPDRHGIFAEPLFLDIAQRDYRLLPNSPAANAGSAGMAMGAYFDDTTVGASRE